MVSVEDGARVDRRKEERETWPGRRSEIGSTAAQPRVVCWRPDWGGIGGDAEETAVGRATRACE